MVRSPSGLRPLSLLSCFFRHCSLVLGSRFTLQVILDRQSQTKIPQKTTEKSLRPLPPTVLGGVAWMGLHAIWRFGQKQGPPLFPRSVRGFLKPFFPARMSAGTQAVACQALWLVYDRGRSWTWTVCAPKSSVLAGKARRPRTANKCTLPTYRLTRAKPPTCAVLV